MKIKYLGHSCFLFDDGIKKIVFDPFGDIGYKQEIVTCDYCICSHYHFDHFATGYVKNATIITHENSDNFKFLTKIHSYHDEVKGKKRGENYIYKVKFGDFIVCHMGDIGEPFNIELCKKIGNPDILLIPVGGTYTTDYLESFKYVKEINAKIVIPMHYKTNRSNIDIDSKDKFLNLFTKEDVINRQADFEITKLPDKMQVYNICDDKF